jgi:hypothetical protein
MSKNIRHQSVISKYSESQQDEDNWINKLEKSLVKDAVQSRKVDDSLFHQINNIMNGTATKSKYTSVEDGVEDMKARSGFAAHISKVSKNDKSTTKIAQEQQDVKADSNSKTPIVIKKCPQIKNTFENFIRDTKGNIPIPAIIEKVKGIHQKDVSDDKDWDEDNLLRYVSQLNLKAKQNNPATYENYMNLGTMEPAGNSDVHPSNTDAFFGLQPVKD